MTRAEAIRQVLENLRVIDAISAPSAEDTVTVGRRLDQSRAWLAEKGLVWWDADSIPDSVCGPFADFVAARAATAFGKSFTAPDAEKQIAAVKSSERREPQRATYF